MERYKLKKDTFFFGAGTICLLTPKGNLILEDSEGTVVLRKHQLESHPELLDEWFEKIEEKKYGGRVPKPLSRHTVRNGSTIWALRGNNDKDLDR